MRISPSSVSSWALHNWESTFLYVLLARLMQFYIRQCCRFACRYVPGSVLRPGVNEIVLLEVESVPRDATGLGLIILVVVCIFQGCTCCFPLTA